MNDDQNTFRELSELFLSLNFNKLEWTKLMLVATKKVLQSFRVVQWLWRHAFIKEMVSIWGAFSVNYRKEASLR